MCPPSPSRVKCFLLDCANFATLPLLYCTTITEEQMSEENEDPRSDTKADDVPSPLEPGKFYCTVATLTIAYTYYCFM